MEKKEILEWRDRLIKMFGVYHSDGQEYVTCPLCGINLDELANHMIKELDKAREEGKKEAFTKDEWFMLKLAMNDIFNSGNTAYEEISEKIESYLN